MSLDKYTKDYERGRIKRLVDKIRAERGGRQFTYGEIDDGMVSKRYFPLGKHLWRVYRELGYEQFIEEFLPEVSDAMIYDVFKIRLDEAIRAAQEVISGKIGFPDKMAAWSIFPPVVPLRGDLAQGTMKLMYGESIDISFICNLDTKNEIFFILNGHLEDGIPVDWWLVGPEDELLDRRHQKLGIKLRDLPKKMNYNTNLGFRCTELLKDVRNERTPQWAQSPYNVAIVYISSIMSFLIEPSVWETGGMLWDGINAHRIYGMPDSWFTYVPLPSFISMLMYMSRADFIMRLVGLGTHHKVVIQTFEEEIQKYLKDLEPELYEEYFIGIYSEGAYWPKQSLGCKPPNLKKKKTYQSEEALANWYYPEGDRITPEALGLSVEEYTKGLYLDITHEMEPGSVDPKDCIISKGWGTKTKVLK